MNSPGDRSCILASRSVVISCSNTAPVTSRTTRIQTELPFGGAAMNSVGTPSVAITRLAPVSVSVSSSSAGDTVRRSLRPCDLHPRSLGLESLRQLGASGKRLTDSVRNTPKSYPQLGCTTKSFAGQPRTHASSKALLAQCFSDVLRTLRRKKWWRGRDSNPRPRDYESRALTS